MKKIKKRRLITFLTTLIFSLVLAMGTSRAGDYPNYNMRIKYNNSIYSYNSRLVDVVINGQKVETGDMPAIIFGKRTIVPVREVFENSPLKANVAYNSEKREVYITYKDKLIVLAIDSNIAYINGQTVKLDTPAMLIKDVSKEGSTAKTMVPLRFVSEAMGCQVEWDEATYTANLKVDGIEEEVDKEVGLSDSHYNEVGVEGEANKTNKDTPSGHVGELSGDKSAYKLPTPLSLNPIKWEAEGDYLKEINEILSKANKSSNQDKNNGPKEEPKERLTINVNKANYGQTKLKDIKEEVSRIIIEMTDPINSVSGHFWESRLVLDIYDSKIVRNDNKFVPLKNTNIKLVKLGQNKLNNRDVSRAVFTLNNPDDKFTVSLSPDRKKLYLDIFSKWEDPNLQKIDYNVDKNIIYKMYIGQNDRGDYIDIEGLNNVEISEFRLDDPYRLIIDFKTSKNYLGSREQAVDGQYLTSVRTGQFETDTTRLVCQLRQHSDYELIRLGQGKIRLQILEPKYRNISYENPKTDVPEIIIENKANVNIEEVSYNNDYINKKISIVLKGDLLSYFGGVNNIKINDEIVEAIDLTINKDKNTEINIKTNKVREIKLKKDNGKLRLLLYKPSDLYERVIVIDPGHGGKDPGATIRKPYEKEVNLDVALKLKKILDGDNSIKVYYTRTTDVYPTLEERSLLANEVGADFFVSIHNNSFNPSYSGTEVLYSMKKKKEGIISKQIAEIFMEEFTKGTKFKRQAVKQRDGLYVLNKPDMPSIVLEMGFMSNPSDFALMTDPAHQDQMAMAIYKAILATYDQIYKNN